MRTLIGLMVLLVVGSAAATIDRSKTAAVPSATTETLRSDGSNESASFKAPASSVAAEPTSLSTDAAIKAVTVASLSGAGTSARKATSNGGAVKPSTERTPPGSYLVYRATTIGQLRQQLATNKTVQARYSKHFGLSPQELDAFIANHMQLISLKSPLLVETWYISRNGHPVTRKKLLPTGTMVFATMDGEPVLSWSCGNPLRADLPHEVKAETDTVDVQTKVLAAPVETITSAVVTAPPAPAVVGVAPIESAPALAFVSAPAVSMPPLITGLGSLGALGALGGLIGFVKGPSYNTPEPSSFIAFGLGLSMLPAMYRLRRRKS